jgi:hypothetical protein
MMMALHFIRRSHTSTLLVAGHKGNIYSILSYRTEWLLERRLSRQTYHKEVLLDEKQRTQRHEVHKKPQELL